MVTGLTILGDTCFKFTNTSSNYQDNTVSLRCACNHVFHKVSVSWGINDGHIILTGLEFPQEDIDGDTMLVGDRVLCLKSPLAATNENKSTKT